MPWIPRTVQKISEWFGTRFASCFSQRLMKIWAGLVSILKTDWFYSLINLKEHYSCRQKCLSGVILLSYFMGLFQLFSKFIYIFRLFSIQTIAHNYVNKVYFLSWIKVLLLKTLMEKNRKIGSPRLASQSSKNISILRLLWMSESCCWNYTRYQCCTGTRCYYLQ